MRTFFFESLESVFFVQASRVLSDKDIEKLCWLFDGKQIKNDSLAGFFVGPRQEMITPWSTNATDITKNIGIEGIKRIECFRHVSSPQTANYDPMLESLYDGLAENSLTIDEQPKAVRFIDDIETYNREAGLALSEEEIAYLKAASAGLKRSFTDAELFSFGQVNSEHCRHKIFNGTFNLEGEEQQGSLFSRIKNTAKHAPANLVSAYKDNVAFIFGPELLQFAPKDCLAPSVYALSPRRSVISLKAETHNFPTTVEPFNGASTGTGGEIRDRMAGGKGSVPLIGTAVYMTAYPRLGSAIDRKWEAKHKERTWKYQSPAEILIKASNGASDFGNKFGQPLIVGSLSTFEGDVKLENNVNEFYAYDRVVMLAGGVGYGAAEDALKADAKIGDKLVVLGGDNYRIGMAGSSVSSVDTGAAGRTLELSAVQRANPEMQKRVFNVIRALVENAKNPIRMVHDHGAGGHMNCFAELVDPLGGIIHISELPVGDPTLSVREILSNESQERMGLVVGPADIELLRSLCERERAPMYVVGEVTGSQLIVCEASDKSQPVNLPMELLLGSSPKTLLEDRSVKCQEAPSVYQPKTGATVLADLKRVLTLEGVACKDWLTNKVDRCVTGRVCQQQCVGPLQLPLSNLGVVALDYTGQQGIATALGHASIPGLVKAGTGAVLSVAEALTNIVWAPLEKGLDSVVLSANWMWPSKQPGEDVRLFEAVDALSNFAIELGIAVPTGKDSLSMTMKYEGGINVKAPGTVIVTSCGHCDDVSLCVTPDLKPVTGSKIIYINLSCDEDSPLGGSSLQQVHGVVGSDVPKVEEVQRFKLGFNLLQTLIREEAILAGHDVSSGGVLGCVAEMAFGGDLGVKLKISNSVLENGRFLFTEKPAVVLQVAIEKVAEVLERFKNIRIDAFELGIVSGESIALDAENLSFSISVAELREVWLEPSFLLDSKQTRVDKAKERFKNFAKHPLQFSFPKNFTGMARDLGLDLTRRHSTGLQAAVIREQGTNGEREMAFALHAAGFDVKDVTMSDLISGKETLKETRFVIFPGGFANSDVLGAAKGWAGVFRYNEQAMSTLQTFYKREDTLSLGVCNGCQLMVNLDLLYPEHSKKTRMLRNESEKFESSFLNVIVQDTESILLKPLVGSRLGVWVAHGEGRFDLPEGESSYDIPIRYPSAAYPVNPNGADFNAAAIVSKDGRHLVMMPHLERSAFARQWAFYPYGKQRKHQVSPWMLAFVRARDWLNQN